MNISKEALLNLFYEKDLDKGLKIFYEKFGPSIRSEYCMDDEDIVDLDWESYGVVVTIIDLKIEQIRLSINSSDTGSFDGWIGDEVSATSDKESITNFYGKDEHFVYDKGSYQISFEFDDNRLIYVNLNKKKNFNLI